MPCVGVNSVGRDPLPSDEIALDLSKVCFDSLAMFWMEYIFTYSAPFELICCSACFRTVHVFSRIPLRRCVFLLVFFVMLIDGGLKCIFSSVRADSLFYFARSNWTCFKKSRWR